MIKANGLHSMPKEVRRSASPDLPPPPAPPILELHDLSAAAGNHKKIPSPPPPPTMGPGRIPPAPPPPPMVNGAIVRGSFGGGKLIEQKETVVVAVQGNANMSDGRSDLLKAIRQGKRLLFSKGLPFMK